eukprot:scaffold97890_cov20-Prasinocladus_malaysianus.AAC.1
MTAGADDPFAMQTECSNITIRQQHRHSHRMEASSTIVCRRNLQSLSSIQNGKLVAPSSLPERARYTLLIVARDTKQRQPSSAPAQAGNVSYFFYRNCARDLKSASEQVTNRRTITAITSSRYSQSNDRKYFFLHVGSTPRAHHPG